MVDLGNFFYQNSHDRFCDSASAAASRSAQADAVGNRLRQNLQTTKIRSVTVQGAECGLYAIIDDLFHQNIETVFD